MTTATPRVGWLPAGPRNAITDVAGVTVGHDTIADGALQTGVTVVRPHAGDVYLHKVPAAATVINGFGKSCGLIQIEELGVMETPIALTNTFGVPAVAEAQIRAAVGVHPEIGRAWPTVNALVLECNDGYLNDIQAMAVTQAHYDRAFAAADVAVPEGAVGAGRGMASFGFKGGIGTASRCVALAGVPAVVGALVLSNFGRPHQLTVAGHPVGRQLAHDVETARAPEKGSIILLLATDAALDARQLRRLSLRAGAGLARTGSVFGHGSGDIALAFSTAYTVPHDAKTAMPAVTCVHETLLDPLFEAAAEACEQAIVNALWRAETVTGRDGHMRAAITDSIADWPTWRAAHAAL